MKNPNWKKCLICGDSRDVIKRIPDNSIDFILTDPPYNIGKHSTGNIPLPGRSAMNNDVAAWDWVDFHPEEWVEDFIRILKPTGNLFIFTTYNQIGKWYDLLDHRFDATNFMIWHKSNPAPKIFQAGFLNSCEMIYTCWNKKHTWNFISQTEMHNFIESPICMRPERLSDPKHPAQKPVVILKKMIQIASNPGDIVFDPFMGVGSTGVAALAMERKFIGVELDKTYYQAARMRIDTNYSHGKNIPEGCLCEPTLFYGEEPTLFNIEEVFSEDNNTPKVAGYLPEDVLQPIIKWAGGKEKELKYILPNTPAYDNYYEPFVGGGSVFAGIRANHFFINDISEELITLYRNISTKNKKFFSFAEEIDAAWKRANQFFVDNGKLKEEYLKYRSGTLSKDKLKSFIQAFCFDKRREISEIIGSKLLFDQEVLLREMNKNLFRKMVRMNELEHQKHLLPDNDLDDNIETAVKSAVYMCFREEYNKQAKIDKGTEYYCALFFFIRNYCYSGMFRYNDDGEFNVPYGGIAYNGKSMTKKLQYYKSNALIEKFKKTDIFNSDFEDFLNQVQPTEDDFVFLDPPYDSEFSTYAQNEFTKKDQERLADYMINKCRAKWMMIIKNTDFIFDLYNKPGIHIKTFDKEYLVSFMNRNDKKVTHLLITNY